MSEFKDSKAGYDLWSADYDQFENPMIAMTEWALNQRPLSLSGLSLLELGCGTGRNFQWALKVQAKEYIGLDASEGMLKKAKEKFSANRNALWIQADLNQILPFSEEQFDFVLITLVLEHLDELKHLFLEISRVLKKNGRLRIIELHPSLSLAGTKAHFWHKETEYKLPSFTHTESEMAAIGLGAGLRLVNNIEWSPNETLIEQVPKLKKHLNKNMLLDLEFHKW